MRFSEHLYPEIFTPILCSIWNTVVASVASIVEPPPVNAASSDWRALSKSQVKTMEKCLTVLEKFFLADEDGVIAADSCLVNETSYKTLKELFQYHNMDSVCPPSPLPLAFQPLVRCRSVVCWYGAFALLLV